jgi:Arc/MetJ-type ribon-helix-helix transcriptional regulator
MGKIIDTLDSLGVEIDEDVVAGLDDLEDNLKVVCVTPDLGESVREMGEFPRDRTVMVRVDKETYNRLDAWVEIGAVKSRSEAAALFIREGLKVRAAELAELEEALRRVEEAKKDLRDKAKTVFGESSSDDEGGD